MVREVGYTAGIWSANGKPGRVLSNITRTEAAGSTWSNSIALTKPYLLVEFGDYQCPPCRVVQPILESFLSTRKSQFGFIFRNFPLTSIHPYAYNAALYAEAARDQGCFWKMHSLLYSTQNDFAHSTENHFVRLLHLNIQQFTQSLHTTAVQRVQRDLAAAKRFNLPGTPSFLLFGPTGYGKYVTLKQITSIPLSIPDTQCQPGKACSN